MALKQAEYSGMCITAAAFELVDTEHFIALVSVARASKDCSDRNAKLFELPPDDARFDTAEEALDAAVAFGIALIDGDIAGESVDDL